MLTEAASVCVKVFVDIGSQNLPWQLHALEISAINSAWTPVALLIAVPFAWTAWMAASISSAWNIRLPRRALGVGAGALFSFACRSVTTTVDVGITVAVMCTLLVGRRVMVDVPVILVVVLKSELSLCITIISR
jgi:hypothetical protein